MAYQSRQKSGSITKPLSGHLENHMEMVANSKYQWMYLQVIDGFVMNLNM